MKKYRKKISFHNWPATLLSFIILTWLQGHVAMQLHPQKINHENYLFPIGETNFIL